MEESPQNASAHDMRLLFARNGVLTDASGLQPLFIAPEAAGVAVSTARRYGAIAEVLRGTNNQSRRLRFAMDMQGRNPHRNIYSDELVISVRHRTRQRSNAVLSVSIWAAFGHGWRSPIVFVPSGGRGVAKGRFSSENYVRRCLQNRAVFRKLTEPGILFQHDRAIHHVAPNVRQFLARHGIEQMAFPAGSADLNPIEGVWALLDARVQRRMPQTARELKQVIREVWDQIPQQVLDDRALRFQAGMQRIVRQQGRN